MKKLRKKSADDFRCGHARLDFYAGPSVVLSSPTDPLLLTIMKVKRECEKNGGGTANCEGFLLFFSFFFCPELLMLPMLRFNGDRVAVSSELADRSGDLRFSSRSPSLSFSLSPFVCCANLLKLSFSFFFPFFSFQFFFFILVWYFFFFNSPFFSGFCTVDFENLRIADLLHHANQECRAPIVLRYPPVKPFLYSPSCTVRFSL